MLLLLVPIGNLVAMLLLGLMVLLEALGQKGLPRLPALMCLLPAV